MMNVRNLPLALVTGASSGIGYELAKCCAEHGYDLIIASDEAPLFDVARELEGMGVHVEPVEVDLSTQAGVDRVYETIRGRHVDALLANAGHGLGGAFLDQDFQKLRHVLDTNALGTIYLVHKIGRDMRAHGHGRILLTGSIAGYTPGAFQAVYNGTKAFIDSFSFALRNELKDTGVTVTCLMPGATDTNFFRRAEMLDTKIGQDASKDDPAEVARAGFDAMLKGESNVVAGLKAKLQAVAAHIVPDDILAEQHRKIAEPGSAASP
jgi:short-subunit dehydrogenase